MDEPAIDDGSTAAQVFVGRTTYVTDVYGCKTDAEFAGILRRIFANGEPWIA